MPCYRVRLRSVVQLMSYVLGQYRSVDPRFGEGEGGCMDIKY